MFFKCSDVNEALKPDSLPHCCLWEEAGGFINYRGLFICQRVAFRLEPTGTRKEPGFLTRVKEGLVSVRRKPYLLWVNTTVSISWFLPEPVCQEAFCLHHRNLHQLLLPRFPASNVTVMLSSWTKLCTETPNVYGIVSYRSTTPLPLPAVSL